MNVTHDQILALFVLKDQRIMSLEMELAAAKAALAEKEAEAANQATLVVELQKDNDELQKANLSFAEAAMPSLLKSAKAVPPG